MKYIELYEAWKNKFPDALIIKRFFKKYGIDVRLYGSENNPAIVIDNKYSLACYVKLHTIHFTLGYEPGDEKKDWSTKAFYHMPIKDDIEEMEFDQLADWVKQTKHRELFYIQGTDDRGYDVYYKGKSKEESEFTLNINDCKLYFHKDEAEKILDSVMNNNNINNLKVV